MTKNMTALERSTTNITKAFVNIVIETKDDINTYMDIATTLTESAQFARAWVLKLAKENVFKGVNNDTIKYADEKFGIKRASTLQYIKIANEYLVDATHSKLCAYYSLENNKFLAFLDDEENKPNPDEMAYFEILDFSYTQIAVVMAKGIDEVKNLIVDGTIHPRNTVADIKKKLKATVEATFTDNSGEETNEGKETSENNDTNENKENTSNTVWYVDENGQKHTFDEITACNTDEAVFIKVFDDGAVVLTAKRAELVVIEGQTSPDKITVNVKRYKTKA